jgi:hypothetical protein
MLSSLLKGFGERANALVAAVPAKKALLEKDFLLFIF